MYSFLKQAKQLCAINPVMNNRAATRLCLDIFLLVLGIWVSLSTGAHAQSIPPDIEPERIRPQAKIELPKIKTVPDAVDYFFEPSSVAVKPNKPYPLVHLRIPKAPYFDPNSSNGPARKYEIYIKMFYPNFSGLADEENAECRGDIRGHCRRQMTVGFGFRIKPVDGLWQYKRDMDELRHGSLKPASESSKYPRLELFAVRKHINHPESDENYYVARDTTGKPEYVIRCTEYVPSPACSTLFRASKSPYIFISLDFVLALLPQWQELLPAVRNKVDSFIVQTYHIQPVEE